ncbi:shikimate dehydrogenase [Sanguibacter antarcticus]|uniref:Shikimate dehydrogenase n=1 Tax=Sanguibacter antarcticus TaxID=372484 RepID=A0A2A9E357_9MICO|nr:shikimate dehydrogenase [Sanguibacter antarcticus]PFG33086.1 shikimate dehydrogenase [Sanguibacter antarcticus]
MARAAVLGHPIAHSLSPVLHRAAYAALGLDDWQYEARDVPLDALDAFLEEIDSSWAGLSLTMPLKQTIITYLDHVDPLAVVTGAVNTVLVQDVGGTRTLVGANTDVHGIVAALGEGMSGVDCPDEGATTDKSQPGVRSAVVLGAGATAASALAALAQLGCTSVDVFVRSLGRTGDLQRAAHRMGVTPRFHVMDDAASTMVAADVTVSTLPAHGADALAGALVERGARPRGVLLDVAYEPRPTELSRAWTTLGGTSVSGERMLLHQAAEQVRLMTGHPAPLEAMSDALALALQG